MGLEEQVRETLKRQADDANERAEELRAKVVEDVDAEVAGFKEDLLFVSDGLRFKGAPDGLREALLMLAREIDLIAAPRRTQQG